MVCFAAYIYAVASALVGKPNIMLIVADDQGFASYGHKEVLFRAQNQCVLSLHVFSPECICLPIVFSSFLILEPGVDRRARAQP